MHAYMMPLAVAALVLSTMNVHGQQVFRCGSSYSSAPCAGGRAVDTSPAVANLDRPASASAQIYLCKSYGGRQFWSREHCAHRQALIERIETVPANLPFNDQAEIANDQVLAARALTQPPPRAAPTPSNVGGPTTQDQCRTLDERVNYLDRLARQPQSGHMQDWITSERKNARDRQFRLRC